MMAPSIVLAAFSIAFGVAGIDAARKVFSGEAAVPGILDMMLAAVEGRRG